MSYPDDPGGVFASDAHRRVMAHLPNPDDDPVSVEDLIAEHINQDPHTLIHFAETREEGLGDVLADLEADGHAKQTKQGWKNTPDGFEALVAPPVPTAGQEGPAALGLDPAALSPNGGE